MADNMKNLRTVSSYPESLKNSLGKDYSVLDPNLLYRGKSYSDYATDWFNWFLTPNADQRNSGPVVFLKSKRIPDRSTQVYNLEVGIQTTTGATSSASGMYSYPYLNEPNVRIGTDRLQIFEDQAVFVPIIVAYAMNSDWGYLQEYCGVTIDNGDNPPDLFQLTVNNDTLMLPDDLPGGGGDFSDFRIATPIFQAVVPDAPYGVSLKDFLEDGPVQPGFYPAMVTGYFVMLKFGRGSYWVHSWASAGREIRGDYFSELLYQIEVLPRPECIPHHRITVTRPAAFQGLLDRAVKNMIDETGPEFQFFRQIQNTLNDKLRQSSSSDH
jgi:hypothetical protein